MRETANVSLTVWLITFAVVSVVILADLAWAWFRRDRITSLREAQRSPLVFQCVAGIAQLQVLNFLQVG